MNFYGSIKFSQGDMRSLVAHVDESVRVAEQSGNPVLTGALHDLVIWAHALTGNWLQHKKHTGKQ